MCQSAGSCDRLAYVPVRITEIDGLYAVPRPPAGVAAPAGAQRRRSFGRCGSGRDQLRAPARSHSMAASRGGSLAAEAAERRGACGLQLLRCAPRASRPAGVFGLQRRDSRRASAASVARSFGRGVRRRQRQQGGRARQARRPRSGCSVMGTIPRRSNRTARPAASCSAAAGVSAIAAAKAAWLQRGGARDRNA